jgi:hypothetical protein
MEPGGAPLGFVYPAGSAHGVVLSLPTLDNVIGYETGDPHVAAALTHAYPRFWRHSLVQALVERCRQAAAERGTTDAVYSVAVHAAAARQAVGYAGAGSVVSVAELLLGAAPAASAPALAGLHAILVPVGDKVAAGRVKEFLQHTGAQVGSRQAQDALAQLLSSSPPPQGGAGAGQGADDAPTAAATMAAAATVRAALRTLLSVRPACLPSSVQLPQLTDDDVILTNSGMAAFTAVYGAVRALWARREAADAARCSGGAGASCCDAPAPLNRRQPPPRRRYLWLQLGWLYLDTSEVMKKLGPSAAAAAGAGCCADDRGCLCCGSDVADADADAAALAAVAARHPPGTLDYDTRRGVVRVFDTAGDLAALADVLTAVVSGGCWADVGTRKQRGEDTGSQRMQFVRFPTHT